MRYALYIRVSSDEQVEQGFSMEAQEERGRAFVKSQGGTVVRVYREEGRSAKDLNRPKMRQLLSDAEKQLFDIVLVYKLDRLSRRLFDIIHLKEIFDKNKIAIESVTEKIDTRTSHGNLIFNMLASFAQYERELISERTTMGLLQRLKNGLWNTSRPFGYILEKGFLKIKPVEVRFIRHGYKLFFEKNLGTELIARELNKKDNVTERANSGWTKQNVWHFLKNPVYCGFLNMSNQSIKGKHKAIISKEFFDNVQKKLKEKLQAPSWNGISPNLLIGMIYCKCGSPMRIDRPGVSSKKGADYRYYFCPKRRKGECGQDQVRSEQLEKMVIETIKNETCRKDLIKKAISEYQWSQKSKKVKFAKEKASLTQKLQHIEREKDNYLHQIEFVKSICVRKELEDRIEKLLSEIDSARTRLSEIDGEMESINIDEMNAELIREFMSKFEELFMNLEPGEKKVFLQGLSLRVEIYNKNKARIDLSLPIMDKSVFRALVDTGSPDGTHIEPHLGLIL